MNTLLKTLSATVAALVIVLAFWGMGRKTIQAAEPAAVSSSATTKVRRGAFVRRVRLQGTVAATSFMAIAAPRLAGGGLGSLVITKLIASGSTVKKGDLLVEFDRQAQIRNALDRKADYLSFVQQIKKKEADQTSARAADETELVQAEDAMKSAELELRREEILSKIDAGKNRAMFEEAKANYGQSKTTFALKRKSAAAEVKSLEIQRDRALLAMQYAEKNTEKLSIRSPLDGIVVLNSIWKGSGMGEVLEGDEVRAGVPFMQVVNAGVMEVHSRINQADVVLLREGQPVQVHLDAYPDLSFPGKVQRIAAIGVMSNLSDKVRTFQAVFSIEGASPQLMPDLSAAVDVAVEEEPVALILPRDCVLRDGDSRGGSNSKDNYILVDRGRGPEKKKVVLGAISELEVTLLSGVEEGETVLRQVDQP